MASILLIEDNNTLAAELTSFLQENSHCVSTASCGGDALHLLKEHSYQLCLLDVGLPDCSGFDLCKTIRNFSCMPIIMLTAFDSEENIVTGLQNGADDYVTKPCSLRVLLSRIASQLRRTHWTQEQEIHELKSGMLTIDVLHRMVTCADLALPLGDTEFSLCVALAKSDGKIMPRSLLLDCIWDTKERFVEDNTLSVHVSRLRKKLGQHQGQPYIETIKGIGYRWNFEVTRVFV